MDKKIILIIILSLIIICFIGLFSYIYFSNSIYYNGYNQGQLDLIIKINQNGDIPIINNKTIQFVNIGDICGK